MQDMPTDVFALIALVFAFGLKHGLDPDHLATIDGLSRFNASSKPWLAKSAGILFSIGHGLIVTAVVVTVSLLPGRLLLPGWLEGFGTAVSIVTLLMLAALNLHASFNRYDALAKPVGLKSWLRIRSGHPLLVLGIGALFALSFDTLSLATFFSFAAVHVSFETYAFVLGIVFTCGMIVTDGMNGILTARFIRQSETRALIASRVMSFTIGSVSLLVAVSLVSRLILPTLFATADYSVLWPGMLVFLWVLAGFALSLFMARTSVLAK